LPVWRLRALHELGTIDMFDHAGFERLVEARRAAEEMGAMSTAAIVDLQLSACFTCRWDLDRSDGHARSAIALAERYGWQQVRAKALALLSGNASMRPDIDAAGYWMNEAMAAAPGDRMLEGFGWAFIGMGWFLAGDDSRALEFWARGVAILNQLPHAEPASARALWPVVLAARGDPRAARVIDDARRLGVSAFHLNRTLIAYAEAILAGRAGERRRADRLIADEEQGFANTGGWAHLARWLAAPSAMADGWGDPQRWVADARRGFTESGLLVLAERCRDLTTSARTNLWPEAGLTGREADVLALLVQGLANKEIAGRLGVSPRTVEKHVESVLRKTGAKSRTELIAAALSPTPPTT
jgi:DNA-binding CsgD family transcriptional regulator